MPCLPASAACSKPHGLLLFSTFGPATLWNCGTFCAPTTSRNVSLFADIAGVGDALVRAGFHQPVLDRGDERTHYPDLPALMRELRDRRPIAGLAPAYADRARGSGSRPKPTKRSARRTGCRQLGIPRAMAWAPEAGTPIREGGVDVTAVPLSRIPIRRRG